MSDEKPEFDQQAYDDATMDFFDEFLEAIPSFRKIWDAADALGYKRGYAAAKAEIIKAVSGLLEEPKPEPVKMIEGPKPETAKPVDELRSPLPAPPPIAHKPPEVVQKPPELLNKAVPAAPPRAMQPSVHRALPLPRWTAERDDLLKKLYPTEPLITNVEKVLNRLPGDIVTRQSMSQRATKFNLRRPPYVPPLEAPPQPAPRPTSEDVVEVVTSSPLIAEGVGKFGAPFRLAPHPLAGDLPAPGPDGKVAAPIRAIQMWCKLKGFGHFDGTGIERLNKFRAGRNEAPVVIDETSGR